MWRAPPDGATDAVTTFSAGPQAWGIAVNPATHRVYLTNDRSASVSVFDGVTNTASGTAGVGPYPWDVDVSPVTNRVYVTNYYSDTVTVLGFPA